MLRHYPSERASRRYEYRCRELEQPDAALSSPPARPAVLLEMDIAASPIDVRAGLVRPFHRRFSFFISMHDKWIGESASQGEPREMNNSFVFRLIEFPGVG